MRLFFKKRKVSENQRKSAAVLRRKPAAKESEAARDPARSERIAAGVVRKFT